MELEIIGIALEAGAEDADGFVNFVHLHVPSREIFVRGRIAGPTYKRALEKRNGVFCVSSKEESETQTRNRICVLRLSFNDLAKQGKSVLLVAGALKRQSELIFRFRGRGIEGDRAPKCHDGLVVFIVGDVCVAQLRGGHRVVWS